MAELGQDAGRLEHDRNRAAGNGQAQVLLGVGAMAGTAESVAVPMPSPGSSAGPPRDADGYPHDELVEDFRLACVSRALDDREIILQKQSRVFFQISGAGHESLLLGLARHLRPGYDWFFPYYRDRALMLGLGVSPTDILLQSVGSGADPASGGRQMPCHWGDPGRHVVTASSPTGTQCLPAVGCAEAARYISRRPQLPGCDAKGDEVTYVSLGEGATSEGEFWESLNTACTLHLPVLYVVADNGYAISVPSSDQAPAPVSELARGFRGLAIHQVDGRDYFDVRRTGASAIARIRAGEGPGLIHAIVTRPYSHSSADTQSKYRTAADLADEAGRDPILALEQALLSRGVLDPDQAVAIRAEAKATVSRAAAAALAAPRPDPASVTDHVYVLPEIADPPEEDPPDELGGPSGAASAPGSGRGAGAATGTVAPKSKGDTVAMGEAIRRTLHEIMAADERVRVFGEDVADAREAVLADVEGKGGVFGTTLGLQREFGLAR
ncbi:MAG: thiamine pyrophosphate-dependent enzyme, partial [Acidimicrobiales bacterium]